MATKWANAKGRAGTPYVVLTVTDAADLEVPNGANTFYVYAGSAATATGLKGRLSPGRQVTFVVHTNSSNITFTDTAYSSTAANKTHLAGSGNVELITTGSISFRQNDNGSWSQVALGDVD